MYIPTYMYMFIYTYTLIDILGICVHLCTSLFCRFWNTMCPAVSFVTVVGKIFSFF